MMIYFNCIFTCIAYPKLKHIQRSFQIFARLKFHGKRITVNYPPTYTHYKTQIRWAQFVMLRIFHLHAVWRRHAWSRLLFFVYSHIYPCVQYFCIFMLVNVSLKFLYLCPTRIYILLTNKWFGIVKVRLTLSD